MNPETPWYNKPFVLGILLLVLPLIALVGIYYTSLFPKNFKPLLFIAALVNFFGQLSVVILFLFGFE
jgi:hypothetical protein